MNASARLAILACGALLACGTSSAAKHPATTADAVADGAEPVDAAAEVTPVFVTLPLRADGHFLRAADGRAVFLRGLNVSNAAKYEPTHNGTASAKAFAQMAGWGFNTVRLLTFWGAVMTAPPGAGVEELQPDAVYLAQLDQRIAEAADAGLLVVLDMHQDIFGFGFGDNGAPPAACDASHYAAHKVVSPWFLNYLDPNVQACFDGLYADTKVRAAFVAAWHFLAQRYKGDPRIVAFDLLNEPHNGSHPVASFQPDVLFPFFRVILDEVRSVDPTRLVVIEPPTAMLVSDAIESEAFARPGIVWGPHHYHVIVHEGVAYDPDTRPALVDAPIARFLAAADIVAGGAGPSFFGEFGVPITEGDDTLVLDTLDDFDAGFASWSYWSYDPEGFGVLLPDGSPRAKLLAALCRPNVQKVAGTPTSLAWNRETHTLTLGYDTGPQDVGATELWAGLTPAMLAGAATPSEVLVQ